MSKTCITCFGNVMWWSNQLHKLKVEKTSTNMCLHWSEARQITGDQSSEYSKLLIRRGPTDLLMRRVAIFWSTPPQAQPVDNLRRRQTPSAADGSLGVKMLDGRVFGLSPHAFCSHGQHFTLLPHFGTYGIHNHFLCIAHTQCLLFSFTAFLPHVAVDFYSGNVTTPSFKVIVAASCSNVSWRNICVATIFPSCTWQNVKSVAR